jgi:hypothetical protein
LSASQPKSDSQTLYETLLNTAKSHLFPLLCSLYLYLVLFPNISPVAYLLGTANPEETIKSQISQNRMIMADTEAEAALSPSFAHSISDSRVHRSVRRTNLSPERPSHSLDNSVFPALRYPNELFLDQRKHFSTLWNAESTPENACRHQKRRVSQQITQPRVQSKKIINFLPSQAKSLENSHKKLVPNCATFKLSNSEQMWPKGGKKILQDLEKLRSNREISLEESFLPCRRVDPSIIRANLEGRAGGRPSTESGVEFSLNFYRKSQENSAEQRKNRLISEKVLREGGFLTENHRKKGETWAEAARSKERSLEIASVANLPDEIVPPKEELLLRKQELLSVEAMFKEGEDGKGREKGGRSGAATGRSNKSRRSNASRKSNTIRG